MKKIDLLKRLAGRVARHLEDKDGYLRASGMPEEERRGAVVAVATIEGTLADENAGEEVLVRCIEDALPFCSLWFKGQIFDVFFEILKIR